MAKRQQTVNLWKKSKLRCQSNDNKQLGVLFQSEISKNLDNHTRTMLHNYLKDHQNHISDLNRLLNYHLELLRINCKVSLSKALDMHFILSQVMLTTNRLKTFSESIISLAKNESGYITSEVSEDFERLSSRLNSWKVVYMPKIIAVEEHNKKKWNTKWKARLLEKPKRRIGRK